MRPCTVDLPADRRDPVAVVLALFGQCGGRHHGEPVSQQSHAVQCATLARNAGADEDLVVAALLHDIGHLLSRPDPPGPVDGDDEPGVEDHHEAVGARWLAPRFGPAVARSVGLHVLAKRYRCTVDPTEVDLLSPASRHSLEVQGGALDAAAAARFAAHPGSAAALALREWDELAKDPTVGSAGLESFVPLLTRVSLRSVGLPR